MNALACDIRLNRQLQGRPSRLVTAHAIERVRQRLVDFRLLRLSDEVLKRLIDSEVEMGIKGGRFKVVKDHNEENREPSLVVRLSGGLSRLWAVVCENRSGGQYAQAVVTLLSDRHVNINFISNRFQEIGGDVDVEAA